MAKKKTTFSISKNDHFSEWYSEILNKAEVTDIRYGVKGFVVIRPWGARILEKMYKIYESALQATGHDPSFFPTVIPEGNFKKEADHVEGFAPELFWLENAKAGEEKLALRPTSETAMYQMYAMWIRSHRDLPLKMYQRANIFRFDTKATRPLIRGREFYWIEGHDVFATKKQAENQVQEDINMTEEIMHKLMGVPSLAVKRPEWDKFPGAQYTIASDTLLPDGKLLQLVTTHQLGQNFSKPFNVKFVDEKEKEQHVWQTCYGPGFSRILASILSIHGDDKGLILPYILAPVQVAIIPIVKAKGKASINKKAHEIRSMLFNERIEATVDDSDKRPGDKFFHWEMKGVPFRIELGEQEITSGKATVFIRDTGEKINVDLDNLAEDIKNLGAEYDARLRAKADKEFKEKIIDCKDKEDIKKALDQGKIARFNYCSIDSDGEKCAEYIEKEHNARIMGENIQEKSKVSGKCIFCNKKATIKAYAGKSY